MAEIIDVIMRLQDNVTSGLARIRNSMEETGKANQRMGRDIAKAGKNVSNLGEAMLPAAAGITALGAASVKTFMNFDQTITAAGVKAGATTEELEQMREAASKMGADFPISAQEAAEGMDRLAAGGFNASQSIAAMPGIIEASIASGEDLATTSDVVTSALSIWNLTQGDVAANTTHVADVIQAAANASKLGMQDFGLAMQYAGAPAAALGVSIEELGTAMAVMSNNGIEASSIGTGLRSMMSRLASPPKDAAAAIEQMGLKIKDASGNFVGLENVIGQMRTAMSGMSNTEQVAMAKAIAGEDAYSGLLSLIKTSPEAYKQAADAINNSSGSSHQAYMTMQKTLKGSIDSLMGSVEALGLSFGSTLAPTIQWAAGGIKALADALTNLSPETKNMIVQIAGAFVGLTGFTIAAGKAITIGGNMAKVYGQIGTVMRGGTISNKALQFAVQGVMRGFTMLRTASVAMLGPWGIVIAAIAAAAFLIYRNWDRIGPFFQRLWAQIKSAFDAAVNMIQPAISKLQTVWQTLTQAFQNGTGVFRVLNMLSDVLAGVIGGQLYAAFVIVSSVITGAVTAAFSILGSIVTAALGVFSGLIEFITGVFTGDWSMAWQGVVDIFSSIFGGLQGICDGILQGIKAAINGVIGGINSISVDIPDWVPKYGGSHFGLNIPYLYNGTTNWPGGAAAVNDRGAEIINLPSGAQVIPHSQSMRNAYNMGAASGNLRTGGGITVNISGVTINNGSDIREFARKVAEQIHYEMEKEAINSTVGAI